MFAHYCVFYRNCFEWESTVQSFIALLFWLVVCYYFESWMVPMLGLLVFLKQFIVRKLAGPQAVPWDEIADSDVEDEDDEDKEKVGFEVRKRFYISIDLPVLKLITRTSHCTLLILVPYTNLLAFIIR